MPLEVAYGHAIAFETYPAFIPGLHEVRRLSGRRLAAVVQLGAGRREIALQIVEQRRNRRLRVVLEDPLSAHAAIRFRRAQAELSIVTLQLDLRLDPLRARLLDALAEPQAQLDAALRRFAAIVQADGRPPAQAFAMNRRQPGT